MSAHHAPDWVPHREGTGIKDNGIFATWLSLIAFTFFLATFVAANVYLRAWSPDKFNVDFGDSANLPYVTTLFLLIAGFIVLLAGSFYKQNKRKAFMGTMVLATIAFFVYGLTEMWLLVDTYYLGAQAWTAYLGIYALQVALALVNIVFIGAIAKHFGDRNDAALRRLVPAAMSVFMYTVVVGISVLLVTDVVSVGQFAEWCGTKLQVVKK
jgi:uncharacterized membrane protein YozB (DUF420 family)